MNSLRRRWNAVTTWVGALADDDTGDVPGWAVNVKHI